MASNTRGIVDRQREREKKTTRRITLIPWNEMTHEKYMNVTIIEVEALFVHVCTQTQPSAVVIWILPVLLSLYHLYHLDIFLFCERFLLFYVFPIFFFFFRLLFSKNSLKWKDRRNNNEWLRLWISNIQIWRRKKNTYTHSCVVCAQLSDENGGMEISFY